MATIISDYRDFLNIIFSLLLLWLVGERGLLVGEQSG